jgi:hypothetical protein
MSFRRGGRVARLHVGPVDDIPERLDVVGLDVLVLQVEGVFPDVDQHDGDLGGRNVSLLVVQLEDVQPLAEGVPG